MTKVMIRCFFVTMFAHLSLGYSNGVGPTICNADYNSLNPSLPSAHIAKNTVDVGARPICEIPDERNVVIERGGTIPIRLYHTGPRKIAGWLLYVEGPNGARVGNFTAVTPNSGTLSGTRGSACSDTSTITHSSATPTLEVNAQWVMPLNAVGGQYTFKALVLTVGADGVSSPSFFELSRECTPICLDVVATCRIQNATSLVAGQSYLELYFQSNAIPCTASDASMCESRVCDVSGGNNGVCAPVYVERAWLDGLVNQRCSYHGYTFSTASTSGFNLFVSDGVCSGDLNKVTAAITSNLMQLSNLDGSIFARVLPRHNCVKLGCKLNPWQSVHKGYYIRPEPNQLELKFDVSDSYDNPYYCMIPAPSDGECYCDDACTRLRDCCSDFAFTCKISKTTTETVL